MSTDSEIIQRSVATPAEFAALFDRHAAAIHRFAHRRAGPDVADDVLSETFAVAFERRATYEFSREVALPWLYGIATVLLKKHRRTEARGRRAMVPDPTALVSEHDHAALEARVELQRLEAALRRLPRRDLDPLLLYAWADLDYEGIAHALNIPVGTVRSRLNRARRILRAAAGHEPTKEVEHGRTDTAALDS